MVYRAPNFKFLTILLIIAIAILVFLVASGKLTPEQMKQNCVNGWNQITTMWNKLIGLFKKA